MSEPMYWTRTKPDRPGLYRYRGSIDHTVHGAAVLDDDLFVQVTGDPRRRPLSECSKDYEWAGPIPEPSEPPEHPLVQELRSEIGTFDQVGHKAKCNRLNALADKIQAALESK